MEGEKRSLREGEGESEGVIGKRGGVGKGGREGGAVSGGGGENEEEGGAQFRPLENNVINPCELSLRESLFFTKT